MSHVFYAVQSFWRVKMCAIYVRKIMLFLYFLQLIALGVNSPFQFIPKCQSCQLSLNKTIIYNTSNCDCAYNISQAPKSDNVSWGIFCRTTESVSFQKSGLPGWSVVGVFDRSEIKTLTLTNQSHLTVKNLTNTFYVFVFAEIDSEFEKIESVDYVSVEILTKSHFQTSPVQGIDIVRWIPNNGTISAKIRFIPGQWNSCDFDFIWQSQTEIYKKEIRQVEYSNEVVLDKMIYDSNYTLIVVSVLTGQEYAESSPAFFSISSPTCMDINSPEACPPKKLEDVLVEEILIDDGFKTHLARYDVHLQWKLPDYEPVSVNVDLKTEHDNVSCIFQKTVPGNETSVSFSNVTLGSLFRIRAWAVSAEGPGPPVKITCITDLPEAVNHHFDPVDLTQKIFFFLFGVCFIIALVALIFCMKVKNKKDTFIDLETLSNETKSVLFANSRYEVPRDSIMLHGILGEGAFGVVRKGSYLQNDERREIAVKTLKVKPSDEEKQQLLQELEILHTIGRHNHVVSLVACCTTCPVEEMLIVVEYCAYGDLHNYLQKSEYGGVPNHKNPIVKYENVTDSKVEDGVINYLYDALIDNKPTNGINQLSMYDLVSFSRQVSDGMAFLAANRIIHRDLAARNVLLTEKRELKISDFGLSRDIYHNDCYTKTSNGKVPIKWMAIESLMNQKYSTQSDVWSFGILMWEIMTFGSTPYEDVPSMNLKGFLNRGNRLPCPEITPSNLYLVMLSCWEREPYNRPHFHELTSTLDSILTSFE